MLRLVLSVASLACVVVASNPPIPGLEDVCANQSIQCSPELCSADILKPGARVLLGEKTYFQNISVVLPPGASIIGAGINKTFVVACGAPSSGRRGFILGNDTYIGHLTWQGLQASRGNFDAAVGTPGCFDPEDCDSGGCIPETGDCTGVQNATAEHIHVLPFMNGTDMWPLSSSAGWFPKTRPWGTLQHTGSVGITLRGIVSWGTWADGINFHGGHHNVLIEQCEISYSGDDPFGLWPVSTDAKADPSNCQQNIILRNNTARWPRQYACTHAGGRSPRDFSACDCSDAPADCQCYGHPCFATYAGGAGIQWINNHCEGALTIVTFLGDYPDPNNTFWCGPLAVEGNTYSAMPGQGSGCMQNNSTDWCRGRPDPPGTVGRQCSQDEPALPPPCNVSIPQLAACSEVPGVGGACFSSAAPNVSCLPAEQVALCDPSVCTREGYSDICTMV